MKYSVQCLMHIVRAPKTLAIVLLLKIVANACFLNQSLAWKRVSSPMDKKIEDTVIVHTETSEIWYSGIMCRCNGMLGKGGDWSLDLEG